MDRDRDCTRLRESEGIPKRTRGPERRERVRGHNPPNIALNTADILLQTALLPISRCAPRITVDCIHFLCRFGGCSRCSSQVASFHLQTGVYSATHPIFAPVLLECGV